MLKSIHKLSTIATHFINEFGQKDVKAAFMKEQLDKGIYVM
jgi:hypothetical protein